MYKIYGVDKMNLQLPAEAQEIFEEGDYSIICDDSETRFYVYQQVLNPYQEEDYYFDREQVVDFFTSMDESMKEWLQDQLLREGLSKEDYYGGKS